MQLIVLKTRHKNTKIGLQLSKMSFTLFHRVIAELEKFVSQGLSGLLGVSGVFGAEMDYLGYLVHYLFFNSLSKSISSFSLFLLYSFTALIVLKYLSLCLIPIIYASWLQFPRNNSKTKNLTINSFFL